MRKILKKASLALVLSLAVAAMTPAAKSSMAASNVKTFTYAEQLSGRKVTEAQMDVGEKLDLRFIGVSDYTNYDWSWTSSNESVAVVDRGGVITALSEGVTRIRLVVGDESKYTSDGVIVYVGSNHEVVLGTSANNTFTSKKMEVKGTMDLNYYGFTGDSSKYFCKWTSTDPTIASVTKDGIILAKREGLTVIQLSLINLYKDEVIDAVPVVIQVGGNTVVTATPVPTATPTSTPTPTVTPVPTKVPTATPTATPYPCLPTSTPVPTTTPTVTPEPTTAPASYRVTVESDTVLLVNFSRPVDYEREDIELYKVITYGTYTVESLYDDIDKVELSKDGTQLRIYSDSIFENATYNLKIDGDTNGTKFIVNIGTPNELVVTYECLGKEGKAYACETEDDYLDIPINLSFKLLYGNIDVTETYSSNGSISYSIISSDDKYNIDIDGDSIYFTNPGWGYFLASYTFQDDKGNDRELTHRFKIEAKDIGNYTIEKYPVEWTIVAEDFDGKIDWENPVHSIVAGDDDMKFVAKFSDNYGNTYVTDDCGADEANGIYSITDETQLFAKKGYSVRFSSDSTDFVILDDGGIFTYQQVKNPVVKLDLVYENDYGDEKTSNITVWQFTIRKERELNKIVASESSVTLATNALEGYEERFCEADIEIEMYDQYGDIWTGDFDFELSCTNNSKVDKALGSDDVASLDEETGILHINAKGIKELVGSSTSSITLRIKEIESNATTTVSVKLRTPATSNQMIKVDEDDWSIAAEDVAITFDKENQYNITQEAVIELFQVSTNGIEVGLVDSNLIHLLDDKNPDFKKVDEYEVGHYYVVITGPDGKVVPVADNTFSDLGAWIDEDESCIKINLTARESGMMLEFLDSGKYTAKVYKVTKISSTKAVTDPDSVTFTVTDELKDIAYKTKRSGKTTLDGTSLESVKEIVDELLIFTIDGTTWSDMDAEMIENVDYKPIGDEDDPDYIFIRSVEFAVPVDGKNANALTYRRVVKGINLSIRVGVDED